MSIQKKPYEISIWEDVLMYVGTPRAGKTSPTEKISDLSSVDYQYYTEREIAVIGSNTMTSPARTVNNIFKRNINGVETLTFDMYYQYEDIDEGDIVHNPLIDLVIDERKIKLHYEDKWHDFIVKKDDEKGRDYKYSFTCTGLAANELGKTGFRIELDTELENNTGTVQELGAAVLDGSDWQLAQTGQEVIQQTNDEALYLIKLNTDIIGTIRSSSDTKTIESGSWIYVYYTTYINQVENYFQFIYVDKSDGLGTPDLYEDNVTINCTNVANGTYDLYIDNVIWNDGKPSFEDINIQKTVANYRGRRYVRKQLMDYDSVLEQTVYKYKGAAGHSSEGIIEGKEYYGYTTTEYVDATTVTNYIYNSTDFAGTSYWTAHNNTSISAQVYPSVTQSTSATRTPYLVVKFGTNEQEERAARVVNDGIIQNYSRINKFEKGEQYRFKIWVGELDDSTSTIISRTSIPFRCIVKKYTTIDEDIDTGSNKDIKYFEFNDNGTYDSETGYCYLDATCENSATWRELNSNVGIFLYSRASLDVDYYIKDIQLYRRIEDQNGNVLDIGSVPEVRINTNYHFYDPVYNAGFTSAEDYVFSSNNKDYYIPSYGSGENEFEKVRSITAKESNRFNLLQELSETFQCWVRFEIAHESNGQIAIEDYTYYKPVEITSSQWQANTYYIYNQISKEYQLSTEYDSNKKYFKPETRKRQSKKVVFYGEILQDNYVGFKYGINLKDNNRTLDSEQIVTKIIVKDNTCEAAENGFCSIARARDNPIKETFALNLDYYVTQGLIDSSGLNNDLYLELNGSIGLYPKLSRYNSERNNLIDTSALEANSINKLTADYQAAQVTYNEAEKALSKLTDSSSGTIFQYTGYQYEDFDNQYTRERDDNEYIPAYSSEVYYIKSALSAEPIPDTGTITYYEKAGAPVSGTTYYILENNHFKNVGQLTKFSSTQTYFKVKDNPSYTATTYFQTDSTTTKLKLTGDEASSEVYIYAAARRIMTLDTDDCINDNYTIQKLTEVVTLQNQKNNAYSNMDKAKTDLDNVQADYDTIKTKLEDIAKSTEEIESEFNTKYSRYIQEGSWTDDNYMDDDLYYLDSLDVLYQSAYPKVSYNFKVLELSQLEGYEAFKFDIGHKTFVEDTEFFGYQIINGLRTPVRETVVVTESTSNLDNPDKNDLKVQNYKSHFEDLFQRITAATQSLEYHSGEYGRAASAVTSEGTVSETVLQKSFNTAAYIIQNSRDQSVTWNDTGIQAVNLNDPAQVTRLASGGILISSDGGQTWSVAIGGYGINANYINAGVIDADKINILSGSHPTFKWDALGLRAYAFETDQGVIRSYDASKYVSYDRWGIYGLNGYLTPPSFNNIGEVEAEASFALTWNGLFIKSVHRDGYIRVSPTEDFVLYSTSSGTAKLRAKFGLLDTTESDEIYGLALYASDGTTRTLTTQSDGTLWLLDSIRIGDSNDQNNYPYIYIGRGEDAGENVWKVIRVYNPIDEIDKFALFSDGRLIASNAQLTGEIIATSGIIGGAIITNDGLTVADGTFNIRTSSGDRVFYVEDNKLVMNGIIYAEDGVFSGIIHASAGDFNGKITAAEGTIGGFDIEEFKLSTNGLILQSAHDNVPSSIEVDNITLGTGANIKNYLNIGNLKLQNPNETEDGTVLKLENNDETYFQLTNDGYINGNNWSIKPQPGYSGVVATFNQLIAENGIFSGTVYATDGNFTGEINSSVINAGTINTANFITSNVRAMGGAYIYRPTFKILSIDPSGTTNVLTIELENIGDYFNFDLPSSGDCIIAISGSDQIDSVSNVLFGKINSINTTNSKINVEFTTGNYNILTAEDVLERYNTLTLFGNSNSDIVIGINSDNSSSGNVLPPRAIVMESFNELSQSGGISYNLKLLLGDLNSLSTQDIVYQNLSGYGLYADNVYLHGSLVTTNATNSSFAGVNTQQNVAFNYAVWSGSSSSEYNDDKIVFWGGAQNYTEEYIQRAPFIVTDKGNVFARSGEFKGSVISDSVITQSIIKAPIIYGADDNANTPSLKIYDTNTSRGGISFYKKVGAIDAENVENDPEDEETLNISINGFVHKAITFISFDDVNNYVLFNGTQFDANTTILKQNELSDGNAKIELINNSKIKISQNAAHGVEITDTGINNFGGLVQSEGTMTVYTNNQQGTGHSQELNYKVQNGYYCLFVQSGV